MEQDKTLGLAVDFALAQVLLETVPGTARITHLSVEDGCLNLSIRAKMDSIQLSSSGTVKLPEPPEAALDPADAVAGKRDQANTAASNQDTAASGRVEAMHANEPPPLNRFEKLDEGPALKPPASDLEELDDLAALRDEVSAVEPKPGFELEEL